jgi:DeoR/GlpR family transcriptional regulator of sugar metabolism
MELSFLERKQRIMEILEQGNQVRIDELAQVLTVSEITVRRDLDRLSQQGLLIKKRGGAIRREPSVSELFFEQRKKEMEAEKRRIGQAAAGMVQRGDVVLLDTGTTTMLIARALKTVSGITIVTNSMHILAELAYAKDMNLILLGGTYRMGDYALSGPITEKNLEMFRARLAFLGADGITAANGITSNDIYTAEVTRSMMAHADTAVLVADHSKVGRVGAIKYAEAKDFNLLITDDGLTASEQEALLKIGLHIKTV